MIAELSFATVRSRLAAILFAGIRPKPGRRSHRAFARKPGDCCTDWQSVRELVSRHLNHFQAKGIIRLAGREVRILNFNTLIAEARGLESRSEQQRRPA